MTGRKIKWIVGGILVLCFAALVAYQFSGGTDYSTDMRGLRSQFNSDKGKVRLLMLLSPT